MPGLGPRDVGVVAGMTDSELEAQIEAARIRALEETDREKQRAGFARLAELVKQRSPEQVARMELGRGLR